MHQDYSTTELKEQYRKAKLQNERLARALRAASDRRWVTVMSCARDVGYKYCPQCGRVHSVSAWCCRHRLCPICAMRRSRRTGRQALDAMGLLAADGALDGTSMYLITLTQRNVPGDALADELDAMLGALTSMRHVRAVRAHLLGSARNIEVTYNAAAGTYHPHVHMLAILSKNAPEMLKTEQYWRDLWQKLMELPYNPVCDVRLVQDTDGAVCEVSKYCLKPSSIYALTVDDASLVHIIGDLNRALAGRKLVTYTGIWRDARRRLNQRDDDTDDLSEEAHDVCGCGAALMDAVLRWDGLQYVPDTTPDRTAAAVGGQG